MRTVLALALAIAALSACRPSGEPGFGNVFVVYDLGCARGCDRVARGDLLRSVDGRVLTSAEELDALRIADGRPHVLEVVARHSRELATVELLALPRSDLPPLVAVPPFWTATATALDRAPEWARRPMFAHASPIVQLRSMDGEIVDGRRLFGRKHLMVYWDRNDADREQHVVAMMQVLQRAQPDLAAVGVEIMFVHAPFPGDTAEPMTRDELIAWRDVESSPELPPVPLFRRPSAGELDPSREIGMELDYAVMDHLHDSPAIVVLDARGIVRWHSEGLAIPPTDAAVRKADQYTIIEAVKFALEDL